jgi:hypothetical protein
MTLQEFKAKENLTENQFEYYVERTSIMIESGVSPLEAHKYAIERIREEKCNTQ